MTVDISPEAVEKYLKDLHKDANRLGLHKPQRIVEYLLNQAGRIKELELQVTGLQGTCNMLIQQRDRGECTWITAPKVTPQEAAKVLLAEMGPKDSISEEVMDLFYDGSPFTALRAISEDSQ